MRLLLLCNLVHHEIVHQFEMGLQVATLRERSFTQVTLIGLFLGVRPDVSPQVGLIGKCLVTGGKRTLERFGLRGLIDRIPVDEHVFLERLRVCITVATDIARERFLLGVHPEMLGQVGPVLESFATSVTSVRFAGFVHLVKRVNLHGDRKLLL